MHKDSDIPIIAHHDAYSVSFLNSHLNQTSSERLDVQIEFGKAPGQAVRPSSLRPIFQRRPAIGSWSFLTSNQRVSVDIFLEEDFVKVRWERVG